LAPPVSLEGIAAYVDGLRHHVEFDCTWLAVWRLRSSALETLRYRLRLKAPGLIRDFLEESAQQLYQLCPAAVGERPPEPQAARLATNFIEAQADLLAKLADSRVIPHRA